MFGFIKPKTNTNEQNIKELLERGVENVFPNVDFIKSKLTSGEKMSFYLGIDPTGPTLHLGHLIPLLKLKRFQEMGHKIILLIGDFTAMIGDPTDKKAVRKQQTKDEVFSNMKEYKKQASKFISFSGSNKAEFKFNSEWLNKMNFEDVLKLSSLVTVDQMLKRDMFQKRMEEGKPIYMHEFMYPLMQGYDSVAMEVDGEVGGNDQTFNMLVGRDLVKALKNKEKFVIATKLLVGPNGVKMGKTEGNMVSLDQSAEEMFGKIMSWGDELIIPGFELVTEVPTPHIEEIKIFIEKGGNPKEMKLKLAQEVVKMCFDENISQKVREEFESTFSKGEFPSDASVLKCDKDEFLSDVLVRYGLLPSKSEWRRLVDAGAVYDYPDQKIKDYNEKVGEIERKIKVGKKTFIVIRS